MRRPRNADGGNMEDQRVGYLEADYIDDGKSQPAEVIG